MDFKLIKEIIVFAVIGLVAFLGSITISFWYLKWLFGLQEIKYDYS